MLKGAELPVEILTEHRNLHYFMSIKQLFCRQACWSKFLSQFNLIIQYQPGKLRTKPDALIKKLEIFPKKRDDRLQQMV